MIDESTAWRFTYCVGQSITQQTIMVVGDDVEDAVAHLNQYVKDAAGGDPTYETRVVVQEIYRLGEIIYEPD